MATTPVCKYFKFGHCKYRSCCRNRHVDVLCEDSSCNIMICEKRHPVICKFFSSYRRCKYNPCSYKHVITSSNSVGDRQEKIVDNENKIRENTTEIKELKDQIAKLQKTLDEMQSLCSRIDNLENVFKKADSSRHFTSYLTSTSRTPAESCSTGSVFVKEKDNACCDHQHRQGLLLPPVQTSRQEKEVIAISQLECFSMILLSCIVNGAYDLKINFGCFKIAG